MYPSSDMEISSFSFVMVRSSAFVVAGETVGRRETHRRSHRPLPRCATLQGEAAGTHYRPEDTREEQNDVDHDIPDRGRTDREGQRLGQDAGRVHPRPLAPAE